MIDDAKFNALLALGEAQALIGWDFSWLNARTQEEPLPWDYRARVCERLDGWTRLTGGAQAVHVLLDVCTGGGEVLSGLLAGLLADCAVLPEQVWASESYPPNLPLARQRLEPLGVRVLDGTGIDGDYLPMLEDASVDLVTDRHGHIPAVELQRLLRAGGRYITQQVGGANCFDINRALQDEPFFIYSDHTLERVIDELEQAGLRIVEVREAFPAWRFKDVAGLVFYLKSIPWQIEGFHVAGYREKLYAIHQQMERDGGWTVKEHRFFVEAEKR